MKREYGVDPASCTESELRAVADGAGQAERTARIRMARRIADAVLAAELDFDNLFARIAKGEFDPQHVPIPLVRGFTRHQKIDGSENTSGRIAP
jgi:hypothetical protein